MQQAPEFLQAISQRDGSAAMQLLSENAALARVRNPQGVSALMLARYFNLPDLADAMLASHTELDVFEAATFGRGERLRALLDGDASLVRARSADTGTALHFACFFAQPEAVKLLLAAGSDVAAVAAGFGNVQPLHSAAAGHCRECVQLLLAAGADPNARQQQGFTPLMSAAQNGDAEMARVLLAAGADATLSADNGQTALDLGRAGKHGEVVMLLEARS